jgi:SAM-dependent methyltransferase
VDDYEPLISFGEADAETYLDLKRGDEAAAVAFLEGLAGGGPALELAIGTGRIALPLAQRGIRVDGIDFSQAMVAKLRERPGGDALTVSIGNYADVAVEDSYRLVYIVFNTIYNLLTQDEQVRCFENVAAHLTAGGCFVLEAVTPNALMRLRDHQYVDAEEVGVDHVQLDVARHDPVAQRLDETHVSITREGVRLAPIVTRYIWPSEMDLMARIAGLTLKERWGGWDREPFTGDSRLHVSVYVRAATA